jgi:hypothetical protein
VHGETRRKRASSEKDGRYVFTLPAQGYFPDAGQGEYPFTPIVLGGGATWSHLAHCYEDFTREDERRAAEFVNAIRTEITNQIREERQAGIRPEERGHLREADQQHVARATAFFQNHFRYEVGEYVLTVEATCSPPSASASVRYRVTLYESDVDTMRKQAERFKYGDGIYWYSDDRVIGVKLSPA